MNAFEFQHDITKNFVNEYTYQLFMFATKKSEHESGIPNYINFGCCCRKLPFVLTDYTIIDNY